MSKNKGVPPPQAQGGRVVPTPQTARPEPDPMRLDAGYRLLSEAIKALIIVNGGAAVATLAFLGQVSQRLPLTSVVINNTFWMVGMFAFGTVLPIAGALALAHNTHSPEHRWVLLGRAAIWGSMIAFAAGLALGWGVLAPLGFFNLEIKP